MSNNSLQCIMNFSKAFHIRGRRAIVHKNRNIMIIGVVLQQFKCLYDYNWLCEP